MLKHDFCKGGHKLNCSLKRVSASTVFLLFQWIYVSQPPFPMQLLCLPSSFPMCLLFPLFILPVFLSLCMPLTLFPFRYLVTIIFIQLVQLVPINLVQLVPINLCFLFTTPDPLPPYYSSFLAFTFWCLSSFILSPIFSLSCLPFPAFSFLFLCPSCFLFCYFSGHRPAQWKWKRARL